MKVIKAGVTEHWGPEEHTCRECEAKLEVALEDLFAWDEHVDYGHGKFTQAGFRCPLCQGLNYVSAPSALLDKLPRRK